MKTKTAKFLILPGLIATLAVAVLFVLAPHSVAQTQTDKASANGHGTLTLPSGQKRQFSFSAIQQQDGTVKGSATIHNPGFDFRAKLDISCLLVTDVRDSGGNVIGKRAAIGGTVRNSNDPNLGDGCRGFFTVFDNGEPGKNRDTISLIAFSCDADLDFTQASACALQPDFDQFPIDGGNIQVRGLTTP
ncbi:MAG: hypothetical protein ABR577_10060 [Pyrinomonadaceae bacterium]